MMGVVDIRYRGEELERVIDVIAGVEFILTIGVGVIVCGRLEHCETRCQSQH